MLGRAVNLDQPGFSSPLPVTLNKIIDEITQFSVVSSAPADEQPGFGGHLMQASSNTALARMAPIQLALCASGALTFLYATVFFITREGSLVSAVVPGIANGLSLGFLGYAVLRLAGYAPAGSPWAIIWHGLFSTGFVFGWMMAISFFDACLNWAVSGTWTYWWFSGPGLTWQMLQGYFIYALISITSAHRRLLELHDLARAAADSSPAPSMEARLLVVQTEQGLVPVDPASIVAVEATGDYVRLIRTRDSLLVKMTMTDAEHRFCARGFIRVHRSWLVKLEAVSLFENVGQGRWRALVGGQEVPVSRSGIKLLKDLML